MTRAWQSAQRVLFHLFLLLAAGSGAALAQSDGYVTNSNQRGVLPFGTYQLDQIDNVNLANGGVNFNIPLWTRKGRGLDWSNQLHYSSKLWIITPLYSPSNPMQVLEYDWTRSPSAGVVTGTPVGELEYQENISLCTVGQTTFAVRQRANFSWEDGSGATVRFPNRDYEAEFECPQIPSFELTLGTSDNGTMELDTSADPYVLLLKDGTRIEFPYLGSLPTFKDVNGNHVSNGVDTVGRSTGVVKDSSGQVQNFVTTYQSMGVTPAFPTSMCGAIPIGKYTQSMSALTRLDLPNGLAYTFQYNTFGEITRIDLPTGGYIRYDWGSYAQVDNPPDSVLACGFLDARRVQARHVSSDGVAEDTWSYAYSKNGSGQYLTTVTDPDGNVTVHTFHTDGVHELRTEIRQGATTVLRTMDNTWKSDFGPVQSRLADDQFDYDDKNWRMETVTTGLPDVNLFKQEAYVWDGDSSPAVESRMNLLEKKDYEYGVGVVGALKRRTSYEYLHDSSPAHLARHILDRVTFQRVYQGQSSLKTQSERRYDTQPLTATSGVVQHDYTGYGAGMNTRGNLTEDRRWLDTNGSWLTTVNTYDDLGNRISTTDPKGYTTTFSYLDSWAQSTCAPPSGTARARLTQAFNPLNHATTWKWNSCSSLPASTTDPNNRTTSWTYDAVDRLTRELFPDGGQINVFHSDLQLSSVWQGQFVFTNRSTKLPLRVKAFTRIQTAPTLLESSALAVYDGLARASMTGASNGSLRDWTRTEYDGLGRERRTSNPVSLADTTDNPAASNFTLWTTNEYDALGRVTKTSYADAAGTPQETLRRYIGRDVLITDPAGVKRRHWSDALGRVYNVREANPDTGSLSLGYLVTTYVYDALDNLTQVAQDAQTRSFAYDSLSRLTSESEPEWGTETTNGTATYEYDANSNLTRRTDAAGKVTTYTHDPLNRVVTTAYSDGTAGVAFGYDAGTDGKGRRTSMSDGVGSSVYTYDSMGRASRITRTQSGAPTLSIDHVWNQAGGLKSESWPGVFNGSGGQPLTLVYEYDNAGRQRSASWNNVDISQNLVESHSMTYDSSGAVETTLLSNLALETIGYNKRLQPYTRLVQGPAGQVLLNLVYDYAKPSSPYMNRNNGNVWSVVELTPNHTDRTQNHDYDWLNRLKSSASPGEGWSMTFTLDRWGNRTAQTGSGGAPTHIYMVEGLSNRFKAVLGFAYDGAGRMTSGLNKSFQYDGEGRLKWVNFGAYGSHGYDGDGRRVKKTAGGVTRHYFYDALGDPVWEYRQGAAAPWDTVVLKFNGKLMAINSVADGLLWIHSDNLGTPRTKTDATGLVPSKLGQEDRDWYYPYGEQINAPLDAVTRRFTGQERDFESGLDYFGARYYATSLGRFTSPDEFEGGPVDPTSGQGPAVGPLPYADITNPQSLNKYAYTLNNPIRYNDPNGHCLEDLCVIEAAAVYAAALYTAAYLASPEGQRQIKDFTSSAGALGTQAINGLRDLVFKEEGTDESDERSGEHSGYLDTTDPSSEVPNRTTDVTKDEFEKNLEADGFQKTVSKDGKASIFKKDGVKKYTTREISKSTDGPTAEHFKEGAKKADLKIRLRKPDKEE